MVGIQLNPNPSESRPICLVDIQLNPNSSESRPVCMVGIQLNPNSSESRLVCMVGIQLNPISSESRPVCLVGIQLNPNPSESHLVFIFGVSLPSDNDITLYTNIIDIMADILQFYSQQGGVVFAEVCNGNYMYGVSAALLSEKFNKFLETIVSSRLTNQCLHVA